MVKYGPCSYYELGRIHPRDRLRESWQSQLKRKRFNFFSFPPVFSPQYFVQAAFVYVPGGQAGAIYVSGAQDAYVHVPGGQTAIVEGGR